MSASRYRDHVVINVEEKVEPALQQSVYQQLTDQPCLVHFVVCSYNRP